MLTNKANNTLGVLLLALCVAGGTWGVISQNRRVKTHSFTYGQVCDYRVGGRGNTGGIWIDFVYLVNNKQYKGSSRKSTEEIETSRIQEFMLHRVFPVVYEPSAPSNSELLVIPEDFKRFGHAFPDSLSWVKQDLMKK
jgi:hypothetical protein